MDEDILKKLHSEQLSLLLNLDRFCREHDLSYFLEGGTALGAIRHQGFIPWDDDIDVGMFREDYEKLIALSAQLPPNLILRTPYNTTGFPGMFAKLCRKGSLFLTQEASDAGFQQEIFIDIFVYDQLAADIKVRNKQLKNAFFWQSASYLFSSAHITVLPSGLKGAIVAFGAHIVHKFLKIATSHEDIVRRFERSIKCFKDGDDLYIALSYPQINALPQECFFPVRIMKFEEHDLPVPNHIERYLENLYGDWQQLPNPEDRHVHSPLKIQFSDGETWANS